MCGLIVKRSLRPCPNCGAGFYVDAGLLANDQQYRCEHCGIMLYIEMRWGKVKSLSYMSPISEVYKGYDGNSTPAPARKSSYTGNDTYWKKRYGDDWKERYDVWVHKDDAWWKEYRQTHR